MTRPQMSMLKFLLEGDLEEVEPKCVHNKLKYFTQSMHPN